jgi:4'-phosphopantetheinyl transferase
MIVHIWRVPLRVAGAELKHLERDLSPDETMRAMGFLFAMDRRRFIAARGSLRRILGLYAGQRPSNLQFKYGPYGKPRLVGSGRTAMIEFNLSHSGDWALVAVAAGNAVGIDVEQIRPEIATAELASQVFSPCEQAALSATPAERRTDAFFKCWTSKEAYIKGLGLGVTLPLREFDVSVHPDLPAKLVRPYRAAGNCNSWSLHDVNAGPGYAATLATAQRPARIVTFEWSGSDSARHIAMLDDGFFSPNRPLTSPS